MNRLFVFFLTLPFLAFGQDKIDFNQGRIVQRDYYDTIPFEYVHSKIIVSVKVNGQMKRFIFDTGAPLLISNEIQEQNQYPVLGQNYLGDISGKQKQIPIVSVREIQIGNLVFANIPSAVFDVNNTGFLSCLHYDGIIGSNLLRSCIVHIDLQKKQITLTDKLSKLKLKNTFQSSIVLGRESYPYVKFSLCNKIKLWALFDSGSDGFITLSQKVVQKGIDKDHVKIVNQGYGALTSGVNGFEKATQKRRFLVKNIKLGKYIINDFISTESDEKTNNIGMQLCDYGTVTIDYIHKRFYFVAKEQVQKYKFQKTHGFSFQPEEKYYAIGIVWTGTQAEKIGLKSGFQILKIGETDISERTPELDCKLFLSGMLWESKMKITYKDNLGEIKIAELSEE